MNLRQAFQVFMSYFKIQRQAKANLPYSYKPATKYEPAQLEVEYPCAEAIAVGYARAIRLPYEVADIGWNYPQGTLIVCLTLENETVATGYGNAINVNSDQRGYNIRYTYASEVPKSNNIIENLDITENLDEFSHIERQHERTLDYSTVHGLRTLSDRPERNQFLITGNGDGFARPRNLPYLYFPAKESYPPELMVVCPCVEATKAGFEEAIKLPLLIISEEYPYPEDNYPIGTLVVYLTTENERIATGYANAVPLPFDRDNVYIEKLDMLDTEYAALVDFQRF